MPEGQPPWSLARSIASEVSSSKPAVVTSNPEPIPSLLAQVGNEAREYERLSGSLFRALQGSRGEQAWTGGSGYREAWTWFVEIR